MAHELTIREGGRVEMAYTGNIPWHGLGNQLERNASIEDWIEAAGMDYRILRARVRYATSHSAALDPSLYREFDGRVVLFRDDTGNPLGDVSDGYLVVQPKEILEFFRDLTEAAGFTLETAGTLFGGRKMWALASIGADAAILDKNDKVKGHLLLCTSADGSMATEGRYVVTRVVCNNTLSMARGEGGPKSGPKVKVNHRSSFKPDDVKRELGIETAMSTFAATVENMRRLAETRLTNEKTVEMTATLFHPEFMELDREKQQKIIRSKAVTEVGQLALDGSAMGADFVGSRGTGWGWLNAVTQWVDHAGRARTVDNRLNSAWFGSGDDMKTTAYETVMAVANTARPIHGVFDANGKISL